MRKAVNLRLAFDEMGIVCHKLSSYSMCEVILIIFKAMVLQLFLEFQEQIGLKEPWCHKDPFSSTSLSSFTGSQGYWEGT